MDLALPWQWYRLRGWRCIRGLHQKPRREETGLDRMGCMALQVTSHPLMHRIYRHIDNSLPSDSWSQMEQNNVGVSHELSVTLGPFPPDGHGYRLVPPNIPFQPQKSIA